MAVYNAAQFLHQAVVSVLSQTYGNFELVVVDDCSSDDSFAILQAFNDCRIQIIRQNKNLGAAQARNAALSVARGEFIAIMDADDVCLPTRLAAQISFLDEHPEVGLIGCRSYENIGTDGNILCTTELPEDNETIQRMMLEKWCFLHSSIMFRRNLQALVGGYHQLFEPVEDHDFVLRLLERSEGRNPHERLVSYRLNPKGLSVVGLPYVSELRRLAVRTAKRRRSNQPEGFNHELTRILALKEKRTSWGLLSRVRQRWVHSFYAAHRYYGFGCDAFCSGDLEQARRCFVQSLRANVAFVKSWIGLVASGLPAFASYLRFMFLPSGQQRRDNDLYPFSPQNRI